MIQGAIDLIHPDMIGGWISSKVGTLRGATLLAFVDTVCVGSGKVDLLRPDLQAAGVGDGYAGFRFPISLPNKEDLGRVVVKLEDSDAALIPLSARVITPSRGDHLIPITHTLKSVEWMRSVGWLNSLEYTFLKYSLQLGVFEHSLIKPKAVSEFAGELYDAKKVAGDYLHLMSISGRDVHHIDMVARSFEDIANVLVTDGARPFQTIGLMTENEAEISVVEGSHLHSEKALTFEGAETYPIGPDRILFLNLLTAVDLSVLPLDASVRVFYLSEPA